MMKYFRLSESVGLSTLTTCCCIFLFLLALPSLTKAFELQYPETPDNNPYHSEKWELHYYWDDGLEKCDKAGSILLYAASDEQYFGHKFNTAIVKGAQIIFKFDFFCDNDQGTSTVLYVQLDPGGFEYFNKETDCTHKEITVTYSGNRAESFSAYIGNGSGGCHCYFTNIQLEGNPTLVTLSTFEVVGQGTSLVISWETASEIDTLGYNIRRSDMEEGPFEQINDAIIAANGGPTQGASYEFIDQNVEPGKTYFYKLEDVDTSGSRSVYGPVSATVSAAIPTMTDTGLIIAGAAFLITSIILLRKRRKKSQIRMKLIS